MREAIHHDEGAVVQAASDLIEGSGKIGDDLVARFSAAYGCPPEQVHQRVQVALRGYEGDAVRGTARAAHTDESLAFEALQDAGATRRSDFNKAANTHFQTGGTKAYEPIATDFIAGLGTTQPARVFVLDALEQALHERRPTHRSGLVHHSDRGSQYVSIKYTERLAEAGIEPSVGSIGDSYDNA